MKLLIVNVSKNGRETPIFVVMPETYTHQQVLETVKLEWVEEGDGYIINVEELGNIDDGLLEKYNIGSFESFFPLGWHGMY